MLPSTPRTDNTGRQRPLQKSMFLPATQSQQPLAPPRSQPPDTLTLNSLKRSSLPMQENLSIPVSPTFHYNQNHINFQHNNKLVQNLNFSSNYPSETRTHSQHEQTNSNTSVRNLKQLNSEDQNQKEQKSILRNGKSFPDGQFHQELVNLPQEQNSLINMVIQTIKERYLNQWLTPLKQDFADEMNTLRLQVQAIKAEINLQKSQHTVLCKEIKLQLAKLSDSKTSYTNPAHSKIKKDSEPNEWQKQLSIVTERISQLQNKFGDSLNKLINELQTIAHKNQKDQNTQPKVSAIKSSLPPIVLEFRESFVIKKGPQDKNEQKELIFTAETYYVDKNGYLIDGDHRYLVDSKNNQIRLEEKHLSLLEEHKILQR